MPITQHELTSPFQSPALGEAFTPPQAPWHPEANELADEAPRCGHCARKKRGVRAFEREEEQESSEYESSEYEGPDFEHDVQPLRTATRDHSLKDIAEKNTLGSDIRSAILTNGENDLWALTNRAFWAIHPDLTGKSLEKTGEKHRKFREEYAELAGQVRALIWLRQVIDELDKHRGTLPREFLLGWMAVESDGRVTVVTDRPERGYFQIDWKAGEAREQLGLTKTQFEKLSTSRSFSIEKGVALAEKYHQWVLKEHPTVPDGTELMWRLVKCRHAASGALANALNALVKEGKSIEWSTLEPKIPGYMKRNVNATLDYTAKLKPFSDLVGAQTAPTATPEALFDPEFEQLDEWLEPQRGFEAKQSDPSFEFAVSPEPAEATAAFEAQLTEPSFEAEPVAFEGYADLEEHQTPAPKSLILLDHFHVPRTVASAGKFKTGTRSLLKVGDLNPGFVDASDNLITDTSATGLHTCLQKLVTSKYQGLLAKKGQKAADPRDFVRIAVVDLTGTKFTAPDLAGWGSTVPTYGASVPKILVLYAACQLRSDLRELVSQKSPADGKALKALARAAWKAKRLTSQLPDLEWLFDIEDWKPKQEVEFSFSAEAAFCDIDDNYLAGRMISKVSLPYIGSLAWQSELFHGKRNGLWLAASYGGFRGSWNPVGVSHSANVTALSAATYFALLAQRRLVDAASSKEIETALWKACITSSFPDGLSAVASKCGLLGAYTHDAVLVRDGEVRYAAAVLSRLERRGQSALYEQLWRDIDQLVRKNNKATKVAC